MPPPWDEPTRAETEKIDQLLELETHGNYSVSTMNDNVVTAFENSTEFISDNVHEEITHTIEKYILPCVCTFGILGNTLSFITFLQKPLRNKTCNMFLATRAVFDSCFLATLLLIWTSSTFELQLSKVPGICQILVFLTYICGCVSVWSVVFVTAENYIRICKPFMLQRLCKTRHAVIVIGLLIIIAVCCYTFSFWTLTSHCIPIPTYYDVIRGMVYTDTLFTLVIPTIIMFVLMVAISTRAVHSVNLRRRLSFFSQTISQNALANVTKMLCAVTIIFLCLNLPSHVVRIHLMVKAFIDGENVVSPLNATIQAVTLLVYYVSLAINVFVYYVFGVKFRIMFRQTFMKWYCAEKVVYNIVEKANSKTPIRRLTIASLIETNIAVDGNLLQVEHRTRSCTH